ncbi:hypothetical protein GG344DRAFT_70087 [Lentinula edodes]|nr:hypothetical protein GG344DRAFT_70087 [Lentinula edodes]
MVRSMRFAITAAITVGVATSALAAPLAPRAVSPAPLLSDLAPSNVPARAERSLMSATRELETRDFAVIVQDKDKELKLWDSLPRDDDHLDPVEHHHRPHSEEVVDAEFNLDEHHGHYRKQEVGIEAILPVTKHREELERRTMSYQEAAAECRASAAENEKTIVELKAEIRKCQRTANENPPNKQELDNSIAILQDRVNRLDKGVTNLLEQANALDHEAASNPAAAAGGKGPRKLLSDPIRFSAFEAPALSEIAYFGHTTGQLGVPMEVGGALTLEYSNSKDNRIL